MERKTEMEDDIEITPFIIREKTDKTACNKKDMAGERGDGLSVRFYRMV